MSENEILPFATIRMVLEIITLGEVSLTEKHKDTWNLKRNRKECMCKRETDSQTDKTH